MMDVNGSDSTLHPALYNFGERARSRLRLNIEQAVANDTRPNRDIFHWYVALGTLSWDVSGSVLLLLQRGQIRAAAMLNRSLFERCKFLTRY
jgi:hypothetical protein